MKGRVAGAPISWGVCEVPGWGYQLPADRVLAEMAAVGLTATEFGPSGYLPADPVQRARLLARHALGAAGGFVPVALHAPGAVEAVGRALDAFGDAHSAGSGGTHSAGSGGTHSAGSGGAHSAGSGGAHSAGSGGGRPVLVLAAATGLDGYDTRPELDAAEWSRLLSNLDRAAALAAERGITATLHPHAGTMVEGPDEVHRVLEGSEIPLCLDTGHLLIGGTDPAELAREAAARIGHVHLKDVTAAVAQKVAGREISYTEGVAGGLYRPLGQGDVDVAAVVGALEASGYQGWYVLEQDTILDGPPADEGPVRAVRESLTYLDGLSGDQR
ncbi:MAG TPA: TIM barrel protein [Streptosporangiaceae bacterium]|nr:TIM barrel protein [Streptosporangiaceae bacterium]